MKKAVSFRGSKTCLPTNHMFKMDSLDLSEIRCHWGYQFRSRRVKKLRKNSMQLMIHLPSGSFTKYGSLKS